MKDAFTAADGEDPLSALVVYTNDLAIPVGPCSTGVELRALGACTVPRLVGHEMLPDPNGTDLSEILDELIGLDAGQECPASLLAIAFHGRPLSRGR